MSMKTISGLLAAVTVTAGLALVPMSSAQAASQYLTVVPAKGNLEVPIDLQVATGSFCPADANRVIVRLTGPGLNAPFNLTGNTDITALDDFSIPGTTKIPLIWGWREAGGNVEPQPVDFNGDYRITLSCLKGLSLESLGDTIADVHIDHAAGAFEVTSPQPHVAPTSAAPSGEPTYPATPSAEPSASGGGTTPGGATPGGESSSDGGVTTETPGAQSGDGPSQQSGVAGEPSDQPAAPQGEPASAATPSSGPSVPLTTIFTIVGVALLAWAGYSVVRSRRKSRSAN